MRNIQGGRNPTDAAIVDPLLYVTAVDCSITHGESLALQNTLDWELVIRSVTFM